MNFKLAIEAGVRQLTSGQLRKAEEQFRFAIKRCAECGAGYRGLAKVFVELDDRPSALEALREGAQVLARTGNRAEAIGLLRDAVRLAPTDLGVHRRFAAALANADDEAGAAAEFERFVSAVQGQGDATRARLELAYAREMLGNAAALQGIADAVGLEAPGAPPLWRTPEVAEEVPAPAAGPSSDDPRERAVALEARAMRLIARRDPRAGVVALEAAVALLDAGMRFAASDVLLQAVSAGAAHRDAQRILAEVVDTLGRGDLSRQKQALLAELERLTSA